MIKEKRGKKKAAIELDMLGWIVLGAVVFIVILVGYLILKGKGASALEYIKNLLSFGR